VSDLLLKLTKALTLALDGLALVGTKGFGGSPPLPSNSTSMEIKNLN
jgi:hypothetical protein